MEKVNYQESYSLPLILLQQIRLFFKNTKIVKSASGNADINTKINAFKWYYFETTEPRNCLTERSLHNLKGNYEK
jgi:hypothetical protein